MREKKPLNSTVEKYIDFLSEVRNFTYPIISLKLLVQRTGINKSVLNAIQNLKLADIKNDNEWTWLVGEPDKTMALEVLNYLLEKNKKQVVTPIPDLVEIKAYVKEILDALINTTSKQNNSLEGLKTPLLAKALNQSEPSASNHLFTQQENREQKRFELVKAIASGIYSKGEICKHEYITYQGNQRSGNESHVIPQNEMPLHDFGSSRYAANGICAKCGRSPNSNTRDNSYQELNDLVIEATDDLMNKLFKP